LELLYTKKEIHYIKRRGEVIVLKTQIFYTPPFRIFLLYNYKEVKEILFLFTAYPLAGFLRAYNNTPANCSSMAFRNRTFNSSISTWCPSSFSIDVTPLSTNPQGLI